jgi:hypothetical protein
VPRLEDVRPLCKSSSERQPLASAARTQAKPTHPERFTLRSCGRRCIPFLLLLREAKGSEVGAHPRSVFRQSVEARRGLSAKVPFVHIEKATIVRHLRGLGRHEDAIRADRELPDRIHTVQDVELFERFGLDPTGFEGETFRDRPPKEI